MPCGSPSEASSVPSKKEFYALILPVEKRLVDAFKIEREIEGATDTLVLELRPAEVEDEGLHDAARALRELLQDDAPLAHCREVVGGGPVAGDVLLPEVELVALEGFEHHRRVAEVLTAKLRKVVFAKIDGKVLAPVLGHALVDRGATRLEALEPIRTRAKRRFQGGLRDVASFSVRPRALPPVLRQDRKLAHDLRELAVFLLVEGEGDLALAGLLCVTDVLVVQGVLRVVGLQGFEGEDHIHGRHRLAVVPARLRAQPIGDGGEIGRVAHGFRQEAVFGSDFIERARHQRVVDQADAVLDLSLHAGNGQVEIIERALGPKPDDAALRRVWVDVIEMLEAGRILRLAEE